MKFAVIVFPGSNCDNDAYYVVEKHLGLSVDFVWHKDNNLDGYDCIIIPGGFSYGDYLRAGAVARFSNIMEEIKKASIKGKLIIGICNGFQILVESGLLPGALITNNSTSFISKNINLQVVNNESIFTSNYVKNETISMPIAHKQGNYYANSELLAQLKDNNQIAFKYTNNPNGSCDDIAGIFNDKKNILGMMPHPERMADKICSDEDGIPLFLSLMN